MRNKEKISKQLQIISNALYINHHRIKHTGLLNGRMGMAIYLYHYARYCGHNVYEALADDIVDDVVNNKMKDARFPNFSGGLSGLAFGFNYLIENKFIEIEDNTVLEDLESLLLKNISDKPMRKNTGYIDIFGICLYYVSKLRRGFVSENDMIIIDILLRKCRITISENKLKPAFDIIFFNCLLCFLTALAEKRIKEKVALELLSDIGNILLKQTDYSIYAGEDIDTLRKNSEQIQRLASQKDKWSLILSKLPHKTLDSSYFNWRNFIYFSFRDVQISDTLLAEIDAFVEQRLDCLRDSDFVLNGKLLNIGIGLLQKIQGETVIIA
jgi:hypothetical protein